MTATTPSPVQHPFCFLFPWSGETWPRAAHVYDEMSGGRSVKKTRNGAPTEISSHHFVERESDAAFSPLRWWRMLRKATFLCSRCRDGHERGGSSASGVLEYSTRF